MKNGIKNLTINKNYVIIKCNKKRKKFTGLKENKIDLAQ